MKKILRRSVLIAFSLIMLLSFNTYSQPILPVKPTTDIYVQDYAGMISEGTREQILEEARQIDLKTTAQVCIVTINSLEGYSIEDYANSLFRKWGIGNKQKDNGVLLLLSKGDREIRIEVGYGLEGRINDAKAGRIIRVLSGYLKQGKNDDGIYYAFSAIAKEIYDEYGITNDAAKYKQQADTGDRQYGGNTNVNINFNWVIIFFVILILLLSNRPGRRFLWFLFNMIIFFGGRGRGGGGGGGSFGGGSSGGGGASGKW